MHNSILTPGTFMKTIFSTAHKLCKTNDVFHSAGHWAMRNMSPPNQVTMVVTSALNNLICIPLDNFSCDPIQPIPAK